VFVHRNSYLLLGLATFFNTSYVLHDTPQQSQLLPTTCSFYCLSEWHTKQFSSLYPTLSRFGIWPYGVEKIYSEKKSSDRINFIYSSFANRGLVHAIEIYRMILTQYPNSYFDIFSDPHHEWTVKNYPNEMKEIEKRLSTLPNTSYKVHGFVSTSVLEEAYKQAHFMLYPCKFEETFCLAALEAQAFGVILISNNLGALATTIESRCILIDQDPQTKNRNFTPFEANDSTDVNAYDNWVKDSAQRFFAAMKNIPALEKIRQAGLQYANSRLYQNIIPTFYDTHISTVNSIKKVKIYKSSVY
jgi:glycosyltransferase involved in cell wall biosynthesis